MPTELSGANCVPYKFASLLNILYSVRVNKKKPFNQNQGWVDKFKCTRRNYYVWLITTESTSQCVE